MRSRIVLVTLVVSGLLLTGCATKGWVRGMMGKQSADTDAKLDRHAADTDAKIGEQKIRVEGLGFRMARIEERAEAAHARVDTVDQRLTRLWTNRHVRQYVDQVDVKFGFDRWDLDDGAQTALLAMIKELQANPNLTVDLTGYTDPTGDAPYNIGLSQRRVESVRRFLVAKGVELPRIHSIGLGILTDRALTDAQKRRVTVRLMTATE